MLALTDNFILLAGLLALAALAEDAARGRVTRRTAGLIGLALVWQLMTAGRAGATILFLGLVAAAWLAAGRPSRRLVGATLLSGVVVFSLGAIILDNGGSITATTDENVGGIWESFELYSLGGIVAFDHTVREPDGILPVWTVTRSVIQVANELGAQFELPTLHPPGRKSPLTSGRTSTRCVLPTFQSLGGVGLPDSLLSWVRF